MADFNAANERVKNRYREFLKEARGLAPSTIDLALSAIRDFERFTGFLDFRKWNSALAVGYKKDLLVRSGKRAGGLSSRATAVSKINRVRQFFRWLAVQDGYRKHLNELDVEYFSLSNRSLRLAKHLSAKPAPTLAQVRQVILAMPSSTDIELRNRGLIACALLTGARVAALASLKIKHVRVDRLGIDQDAREVHTKFAKTQTTYFFPVGVDVRNIFLGYVDHLKNERSWGLDDPLFPATDQKVGDDGAFHVCGLKRSHWVTADPIRDIFRQAYAHAGVPYFSPHTLRNLLALLGEELCRTPEEFKAWSQNLGHDDVLTTFTSYGAVPASRQAEILRALEAEKGDKWDQFRTLWNDPEIQAKLKGNLG